MRAFDRIVQEASKDWQYTDDVDVGDGLGSPGAVGANGEIIAICDFWFGEKRQPTRAQAQANARLAVLGANHVGALVSALQACGENDWWCEECEQWIPWPMDHNLNLRDDFPVCPLCDTEWDSEADLEHRVQYARQALATVEQEARALLEEGT